VRIPNINQTGVPGAEQLSLGAISSAAQAKMRTSQALTKVVDTYQAKVQKAETDEEYSRLTNSMKRDSDALWQGIQDQDRVDENGVPTHNAMLGEFNQGFKKLQDKYAGLVQFTANKGHFNQAADSMLTTYTSTVNGEVGRRKNDFLRGRHAENMISFETDPDGLAKAQAQIESSLSTGVIDSAYAVNEWDKFQHTHHTNSIMSKFQAEREAGRGQEFAENIPFPETFDEGEQQRIKDQITADLNNDRVLADRAEAKVKQEATALEIATWNTARKGKVMLESGRTMTQEQLSQLTETISQLTDPDHQEQMSISLDVYNNIQSLMSMTKDERTAALNETLGDIKDNRDLTIKESTQRAVAAIESAVASDPHQAWVMYGGGEPMEEITKDNLVESLTQAQANQTKVSAWLGEDAPPMSLSQLNNLKTLGVSALDEILTAYGQEDSKAVLTLLYKENAGEMAAVGAIALQTHGEAAYQHYMIGDKIIKENSDYALGNEIGKNNDSARSLFHEATKGLFPQHAQYSKSLQEVANKIYVGLAEQNQIKPGELDSDIYKQAVTMAVGNIVEYNDHPLILPTRQWTEGRFNDAIESLTPAQVNDMGGFAEVALAGRDGKPRTVSPDAMLKKLQRGEAQLRQGSEFGQYQVWFDGRRVENGSGEPFILDLSEK